VSSTASLAAASPSLERLADEAKRALPDIHECRRINARFHEALLGAARSPVYAEVLRLLFQRSLFAVPLTVSSISSMVADHSAIARALRKGDRSRAEHVMAEHLGEMITMLRSATAASAAGTPAVKAKTRGPKEKSA
jgi:DNA-binding GntR family transcriptional regulator